MRTKLAFSQLAAVALLGCQAQAPASLAPASAPHFNLVTAVAVHAPLKRHVAAVDPEYGNPVTASQVASIDVFLYSGATQPDWTTLTQSQLEATTTPASWIKASVHGFSLVNGQVTGASISVNNLDFNKDYYLVSVAKDANGALLDDSDLSSSAAHLNYHPGAGLTYLQNLDPTQPGASWLFGVTNDPNHPTVYGDGGVATTLPLQLASLIYNGHANGVTVSTTNGTINNNTNAASVVTDGAPSASLAYVDKNADFVTTQSLGPNGNSDAHFVLKCQALPAGAHDLERHADRFRTVLDGQCASGHAAWRERCQRHLREWRDQRPPGPLCRRRFDLLWLQHGGASRRAAEYRGAPRGFGQAPLRPGRLLPSSVPNFRHSAGQAPVVPPAARGSLVMSKSSACLIISVLVLSGCSLKAPQAAATAQKGARTVSLTTQVAFISSKPRTLQAVDDTVVQVTSANVDHVDFFMQGGGSVAGETAADLEANYIALGWAKATMASLGSNVTLANLDVNSQYTVVSVAIGTDPNTGIANSILNDGQLYLSSAQIQTPGFDGTGYQQNLDPVNFNFLFSLDASTNATATVLRSLPVYLGSLTYNGAVSHAPIQVNNGHATNPTSTPIVH